MSDAKKKKPESSKNPAPSPAPGGADIDALLAQAQREKPAASGAKRGGSGPPLRDLWQAPVLALGAALFVGGVIAAFATKPDFDVEASLARAQTMLEEGDSTGSLAELNGKLLEKLGVSDAPESRRLEFHRLRLGAMSHEIRAKNIGSEENYRRVLAEVKTIESLGATLDAGELARTIEAHLALGDLSAAIERVNQIPSSDSDNRRQLMLKQVIRAAMDSLRDSPTEGRTPQRFEQALALLTRLGADPALDERDRAWTIARQAELRLEAGYNAEAVGHLLREMQRIDRLDSEQAGELYLLLGTAYFNLGQHDEAVRRLNQADATLGPTDQKRASANVMLARIALQRGDAEQARERFAFVTTSFAGSDDTREAWLGLAEAEGGLGNFDASAEAYETLVQDLRRDGVEGVRASGTIGPSSRAPVSQRVIASLRDRADERLERGDPISSLRFAQLAERVRDPKDAPAWSALAQARAHRVLADTKADASAPSGDRSRLHEADPVSLREIKTRYLEAATQFRRHAQMVIGTDDRAFAESLWNAADSADLAGDFESAIRWFGEYANGRPNDARRDSARFRLARAHDAREELAPAVNLYRDLIAENPSSGEGFRSYVPLARALLRDRDETNDAEAENLLRRVLSGQIIAPSAPEFRVALDELGRHLLRTGRHPEAISRLTESLERYPASPDRLVVRFRLAEALRQSGGELSDRLRQGMPESQRRELERLRQERLRQAMAEYERVALRLDEPAGARLSEVEASSVRNAFFFRADCAFDLGEFARAIEFYDAAAQRFSDDPASLVAMVQIVNAYAATGRWDEARTAHERARQRFRELPADSFDRPDMPMDRSHWERWLDSVAELAAHRLPD